MTTEAPDKLTIRNYRDTDFEACCGLFLSNTPQFFTPGDLAEYQHYLLEQAAGSYWMIEDEASSAVACGGISIGDSGDGAFCFGIVRADRQRRGLGSLLLALRLNKLIENGKVERIVMETSRHDPQFFSQFGIKVTETASDFFAPGQDRHTMTLTIESAQAFVRELMQVAQPYFSAAVMA